MKKSIFTILSIIIIGGCAPVVNPASAVAPTSLSNQTQVASPAAAPNIQSNQMQIAFTQAGQHPEKLLIEQINAAKSTIDTAIYSFTLPEIKNAMIAAAKRGVKIRVISDRQEAGNKYQAQALSDLMAAGIPVKVNLHPGLMHLKQNVIDNEVFTIGSFNESKQASTLNDEVLMVVHDKVGAQECEKQFERMWQDKSGFEAFKG